MVSRCWLIMLSTFLLYRRTTDALGFFWKSLTPNSATRMSGHYRNVGWLILSGMNFSCELLTPSWADEDYATTGSRDKTKLRDRFFNQSRKRSLPAGSCSNDLRAHADQAPFLDFYWTSRVITTTNIKSRFGRERRPYSRFKHLCAVVLLPC